MSALILLAQDAPVSKRYTLSFDFIEFSDTNASGVYRVGVVPAKGENQ